MDNVGKRYMIMFVKMTDCCEPMSKRKFFDGVIDITAQTSRWIEPRYKS
jgi:hypothetical protein